MKILMLSWNFPPALGGIEYVAYNLYEGLVAANHTIQLVTTTREGAVSDPSVFRASKPGLKAYVVFAFKKGRQLCKANRPDIIVCPSIASAPAAFLLSKLYRIPYVVLMHGSDILFGGKTFQLVVKKLCTHATALASNSEQTKQLLIKAGIPEQKISVIHPGVRADDFANEPVQGAEEILEEVQGCKVILAAGRLIERKGMPQFVEKVMPDIVKAVPNVKLLIAGDDAKQSLVHGGGIKAQIAAMIEKQSLQSNVKLLGRVSDEDLVKLFFRADVFVMPCLHIPGDIEGFGIVFSEAALSGTPSVATRVGGIPEAVEDGVTGLLCEPEDWNGIAKAVTSLLTDEALRQKIAAQGADRTRRLLAWPVIVKKYENLFNRCVTG